MPSEECNDAWLETFRAAVQDPERTERQRALKSFGQDFTRDAIIAEECPRIFDDTYLHILRCYGDRFESVRTLAVAAMDALLGKLPPNDYYLGCIVPVLAKRIGQAETIEDSEEVRLQLLEQLKTLVAKYSDPDGSRSGDPLLKVLDSVIDTLIKSLRDPFPAAQKKSCEIVIALAEATSSLHYRAEALVAPAKSILTHRHSANRIAAVEALGVLSLHILSNGDCVSEIIMAVSPLLMDDVPFVRRACGRVGCLMLQKLRDRYSFFHRILPLVLNCLCDDTVQVREDIEAGWKQAGELYYRENETELSKAALIETVPQGYPVERYRRPTLACRAIVQRSLRVVNLVLHEMEEWKENIRLQATKLLKQIVLHAERSFSTLFLEVNPVLAKACMDAEKSIVSEALSVCELMGILLDYDTWSQHMLATFQNYPTIGQLRCMRTLFASCVQDEAKCKDVRKFATLLLDPDVCHNHRDAVYQRELLEFCSILASTGQKQEALTARLEEITVSESNDGTAGEQLTLERTLYTVALKVVAFCYGLEDRASVRDLGMTVLGLLDSNIDRLHQHHLASVLSKIEHLESENSDASTSILLLCGIVAVCGFQDSYFTILNETLQKAVAHAAPEGKVKLFSAISVAMLSWNVHNAQSEEDQIAMLKALTDAVIAPHLVWSAGRSAESVRAMATACFASMAQGVDTNVYMSLLPTYLNVLSGLIDDNCIATRAYSLKALVRLQALNFESLKLIAFPIMSRLDDPSGEVRELAAVCLGRLQLDVALSEDGQQNTVERWQDILRQILSVMFLHLEHPETKLRCAIFDSLKRLHTDNRELIERLASDVPSGCSYKKDLETITSRTKTT
ncbi:dynein assembly factor 5, axonemal [Anopheles merus]|uniref:TOG domain-containing protein n=1 Tax=Anopheles merus TaxID=30066 RepID=A0A182VDN9_ANOME|nr:dynein assembly factor 5, axonemal [Anopheles merus]XP_041766339.1 dynein assembly factor 5, axonemal [Anopheles merus]XP_041766340.1 dynein assembly factor 5, axonemal [Anopheles merus]XP_041766341.1 dynein assembly factor 5, axonemal [Anopheles merus]